jgi:hypothetical protein
MRAPGTDWGTDWGLASFGTSAPRLRSAGLAALGAALAAIFAAPPLRADDTAAANALYKDGVALMGQSRFAEACPKLVESQRLDPGGGTLVAIALCHEGQGMLATAWADWDEALARAKKDGRTDREAAASQHLGALEPRLSSFRVVVVAERPGLEVKRDGAVVGRAQWGTAVPVDPGDHLFEASAPGAVAWKAKVPTQDGRAVEVTIPALDDASPAPAPAPPALAPTAPPPAVAPPPATTAPAQASSGGSSTSTAGLVVGGAGIALVAVGGIFGLTAFSKWSDAKTECPNLVCPSSSQAKLGTEAVTAADLSSVLVGVGLAAVVTGGVLLIAGSHGGLQERAVHVVPVVGPATAGASVGGSF